MPQPSTHLIMPRTRYRKPNPAHKLLYGFMLSGELAQMADVPRRSVMRWREEHHTLKPDEAARVACAIHHAVQRVLPEPRCITKLNRLMGYEGRAA